MTSDEVRALMAPGLDLPTLEHLLARPAWMADAACREPHPGVNFHPERGESTAPAKAVCAGCLVRDECREFGLADPHGIWGGTSGRERRGLRRQADRPAA